MFLKIYNMFENKKKNIYKKIFVLKRFIKFF
jgi:hypothetical protein